MGVRGWECCLSLDKCQKPDRKGGQLNYQVHLDKCQKPDREEGQLNYQVGLYSTESPNGRLRTRPAPSADKFGKMLIEARPNKITRAWKPRFQASAQALQLQQQRLNRL